MVVVVLVEVVVEIVVVKVVVMIIVVLVAVLVLVLLMAVVMRSRRIHRPTPYMEKGRRSKVESRRSKVIQSSKCKFKVDGDASN